jgi:hypothetical protein
MEKQFKVFEPGSVVDLGGDGKEATVIGVSLTGNGHITYRVIWWDGNTRNDVWVESCEVKPHETKSRFVGFTLQPHIEAPLSCDRTHIRNQTPRIAVPITEGRVCKGGQNLPNATTARPPAPQGSGA